MNSVDAAEAITKLQSLSDERACKVVSLIDDLAELEALEDAEDLKDAREALAEVRAANPSPGPTQFANELDEDRPLPNGTVSYEKIRRELGLDR